MMFVASDVPMIDYNRKSVIAGFQLIEPKMY